MPRGCDLGLVTWQSTPNPLQGAHQGKNTFGQIPRSALMQHSWPTPLHAGRGLVENEVEWAGKPYFLSAGEACNAIFWPTPGCTDRTLDGSGFSAGGTLISLCICPISHHSGLKEGRNFNFYIQSITTGDWKKVGTLVSTFTLSPQGTERRWKF